MGSHIPPICLCQSSRMDQSTENSALSKITVSDLLIVLFFIDQRQVFVVELNRVVRFSNGPKNVFAAASLEACNPVAPLDDSSCFFDDPLKIFAVAVSRACRVVLRSYPRNESHSCVLQNNSSLLGSHRQNQCCFLLERRYL